MSNSQGNLIPVTELACFNVTLGGNSDEIQADTVPEEEGGEPDTMAGAILNAVDTVTSGMSRIMLLLSGGYDSRCLLAALMHLGKDVTCCCWDIENPVSETWIAEDLAARTGYPLLRLSPGSLTHDDLDDFLESYIRRTSGLLPTTRLRTAAAVSGVNQDIADCIVWGEGELIRPPVVPGEYLPASVRSLLDDRSAREPESRPEGSFFSESLPWSEAIGRFRERTSHFDRLPETARYSRWLRDFSYPHIYGQLARAASGNVPVVMPFLSRPLSRVMLRNRKHPISARRSWKPSLRYMLSDRRLYHDILGELAPELLRVRTDRGYPPAFDGSPLAPLLVASASVRSFLRHGGRRGSVDTVMRKLVADRLSECLPSPVADNDRVKAVSGNWMSWSPSQYYELSKLLAAVTGRTRSFSDD